MTTTESAEARRIHLDDQARKYEQDRVDAADTRESQRLRDECLEGLTDEQLAEYRQRVLETVDPKLIETLKAVTVERLRDPPLPLPASLLAYKIARLHQGRPAMNAGVAAGSDRLFGRDLD